MNKILLPPFKSLTDSSNTNSYADVIDPENGNPNLIPVFSEQRPSKKLKTSSLSTTTLTNHLSDASIHFKSIIPPQPRAASTQALKYKE